MAMWSPPTPPQDDNDIYIDHTISFLYEPSVMPESQLPPVYVKKEHKRVRVDPAVGEMRQLLHVRKHKVRKEEAPRVPRSLFDRPLGGLRRDAKLVKLRPTVLKPLKSQLMTSRPLMDHNQDHAPEWLIHEDWALLQAVQMLQQLPLSLSTGSPAHIPNWDLVADVVNSTSRTYRSSKQCKNRYELVIVPREEGRILYDINPRKPKKSKGIYKVHTKNNRPMRTSQLYLQNNHNSISTLYSLRFDSCKLMATKRTPTFRPTVANPTLKNPKHAAVLAENGINYEQPLTPVQVAAIRAEKIAKDKKEQQMAAHRAQQQQQQTTQLPHAVQTGATLSATVGVTPVSVVTTTIVQGPPVASAANTTVVPAGVLQKAAATAVSGVSLARFTGAPSIVVNAAGGVASTALTAINKRLGQTMVGTVAQTAVTTVPSSLATMRATRPGTTQSQTASVQEITAAVVNQGQISRVANTTQVFTSTTLPTAQLVAQKSALTATTVSAGSIQQQLNQGATKALTPQQLNILRQQALLKQQQQQLRQAHLQAQQSQSGAIVQKTVMTTPLITTTTQAARLQAPKTTIKQTTTMTDAQVAALLRKQQFQQKVVTGSTGQPAVQQVQVSQSQGARLTAAQIITGTPVQVQQMAGQSAATLVKTVSTQGSSMPSVTIPVSAMGLGISVSMPQQPKPLPGKPQQLRQLHFQQLQRNTAVKSAQQLAQQKVAATLTGQLQQVAKTQGTTPLMFPQQPPISKVMVQQIHQIMRQQPQQQQTTQASAATIQQIITSIPTSQTTTATVIATQVLTQAHPTVHTMTRVAVPTNTTTTGSEQVLRTAHPVVTSVVSAAALGTTAITSTHQATTSVAGTIPAPTSTLSSGQQPLLVKHVQDIMVSPQKTLSVAGHNITQQLKNVTQTRVVGRQPQPVSVGQTTTQSLVQPATLTQQQLQTASPVTVKQQQPSSGVQVALQQVVQHAAAQRQQHQAAGLSSTPTLTTMAPPTASTPVAQVLQAGSTPTTALTLTPATVASQQSPTESGLQDANQQGRTPAYTMRLRNQRNS